MQTPAQQVVNGTWKQFRGKLLEMWGDLTSDDLDRMEGKREQIEGYVEKKTGQNRQAIRNAIDRVANEVKYSF